MGSLFYKKLEGINYDEVSNFSSASFEWMFKNERVRPFVEWVCNTVEPDLVLSEEELKSYDQLVKNQVSILKGEKLATALEGYEAADARESELKSRANIEYLKAKKVALTTRVQKLKEVENSLRKQVSECEASKKQVLQLIEKPTYEPADYPERWFSKAKHVQTTFEDILKADSKSLLLSYRNVTPFLDIEEQYNQALQSFIANQFFEGMGDLGHNEGDNQVGVLGLDDPFVLADLTNDPVTRVRHGNHLAFFQTELCEAEEERLYTETLQSSTQAALFKVQELQQMLQSEQFTSLSSKLKMDVENLPSEIDTLRSTWMKLRSSATTSLQQYAQQLCSRVMVGECHLKLYRQQYYMNAQTALWTWLKSQWARNELLVMAMRLEGKALDEVLQSLRVITSDIQATVQRCEEKKILLRNTSYEWQKKLERSTLSSNDLVLLALLSIMDPGKQTKPNLIPYRMLPELTLRLKTEEREILRKLHTLQDQQTRQCLLHRYLVDRTFALTDVKPSNIQAGPILRALHEVSVQLSKLENSMKPLNKDFETKKMVLESDCLVAQERTFWRNFYIDPQALLKALDTM